MRPGQNKRMRGRNNNGGNRKGPNPLTRSYESNGPDVKIRGTAQHIGEKYLQLARDAQTSGDPVAAESYLQHAEHYFRLIAAAQQAQYQAQNGFARQGAEGDTEEGDDEDDLVAPDRFALPSERMQPQPAVQPNANYGERPPMQDRSEGQDRGYRQDRPEGQDRPYRQDRQDNGQDRPYRQDRYNNNNNNYEPRGFGDRQGQQNYDRNQDRNQFRNDRDRDRNNNRQRFNRDDYRDNRDGRDNRDNRDMQYREQPRMAPPREQPLETRPQPVAPALEAAPDLPAFITAPVRPASPPVEPTPVDVPATEPTETVEAAAEQVTLRPRRRRRSRVAPGGDFDTGDAAPSAPASDDSEA